MGEKHSAFIATRAIGITEMSEESKAIEETAKAAQKAIETGEKVGRFLDRIVGGALVEAGGIFADWAAYFRYRNFLVIQNKVEAIHRERGIDAEIVPLPPRLAVPILENASLEEDETLQDVWARLIANSTDPERTTHIHPAFVEIIRELSSDEARILDAARETDDYPNIVTTDVDIGGWSGGAIGPVVFADVIDVFKEFCSELILLDKDSVPTYLDNLKRLQLLDVRVNTFSELNRELSHGMESGTALRQTRHEYVVITDFGSKFIDACIKSE